VVQDRTYQTPVRDVADLKQRLIDASCKALYTVILMNGVRELRAYATVDEKNMFEHLLWDLGSSADLLYG